MPIFSYHPSKNWNLCQMNAQFPPSPYPKLFRIAWQLYTLVFRPRQLWIGGGEGAYFFCLEERAVGCKRLKIDGIVSTVLSGVVAWYELCMRNQTQHINFEKLMEINFALEKMYPQNTYIRLIRSSGMGNCLFLHAQGWWVDHQERQKTANPRGMPAVAWQQVKLNQQY